MMSLDKMSKKMVFCHVFVVMAKVNATHASFFGFLQTKMQDK